MEIVGAVGEVVEGGVEEVGEAEVGDQCPMVKSLDIILLSFRVCWSACLVVIGMVVYSDSSLYLVCYVISTCLSDAVKIPYTAVICVVLIQVLQQNPM